MSRDKYEEALAKVAISQRKRRPGVVITLRVSTKDVMTAIDIWDKLQADIPGASLSQVISTALKSAFETFRRNNIVPDRDGFEYAEMVARFPMPSSKTRGMMLGADRELYQKEVAPVLEESLEARRAKRRMSELKVKQQSSPESMSDADWAELAELINRFD